MSVVRKSITFTTQQDLWIKQQIENGGFTNDSEYVRNLIRKDQEENQKLDELKFAIQQGIDSGVSSRTVEDIWKAAEKRYAEKKQ